MTLFTPVTLLSGAATTGLIDTYPFNESGSVTRNGTVGSLTVNGSVPSLDLVLPNRATVHNGNTANGLQTTDSRYQFQNTNSAFSLACRCRRSVATTFHVAGVWDAAANDRVYRLLVTGGGNVRGQVSADGAVQTQAQVGGFTTGTTFQWIDMTYDPVAEEVTVRLNQGSRVTVSLAASFTLHQPAPAIPFTVGVTAEPNQALTGNVDVLGIWNITASDSEIDAFITANNP